MKFLVLIILVMAFLSVAPGAEAFNDGYQCTALTEASIGYALGSNRVETGGGNVERPYTVRLSGVVSDRPVLHAQNIVPLSKFGEASNVIWFGRGHRLERLSPGLCLKRRRFGRLR